jgi:hypothetical protein
MGRIFVRRQIAIIVPLGILISGSSFRWDISGIIGLIVGTGLFYRSSKIRCLVDQSKGVVVVEQLFRRIHLDITEIVCVGFSKYQAAGPYRIYFRTVQGDVKSYGICITEMTLTECPEDERMEIERALAGMPFC